MCYSAEYTLLILLVYLEDNTFTAVFLLYLNHRCQATVQWWQDTSKSLRPAKKYWNTDSDLLFNIYADESTEVLSLYPHYLYNIRRFMTWLIQHEYNHRFTYLNTSLSNFKQIYQQILIEGTIAVHQGVSAVSGHEKSNFVFLLFFQDSLVKVSTLSLKPFLSSFST